MTVSETWLATVGKFWFAKRGGVCWGVVALLDRGIALAIERQSRLSAPEAVESPDLQFGQFIYGERRTVVGS